MISPTGFFANIEKDNLASTSVDQYFDNNVGRAEQDQSVIAADVLNNKENTVKEKTNIGDHVCNVVQNSSHAKGTVDNNQLGMHLFS